jgi:hypothetical protein
MPSTEQKHLIANRHAPAQVTSASGNCFREWHSKTDLLKSATLSRIAPCPTTMNLQCPRAEQPSRNCCKVRGAAVLVTPLLLLGLAAQQKIKMHAKRVRASIVTASCPQVQLPVKVKYLSMQAMGAPLKTSLAHDAARVCCLRPSVA